MQAPPGPTTLVPPSARSTASGSGATNPSSPVCYPDGSSSGGGEPVDVVTSTSFLRTEEEKKLEKKLEEMSLHIIAPSELPSADGATLEPRSKDAAPHFPPSPPRDAVPVDPGMEGSLHPDYFPQQVELTVHVLNSHIGRIIGRGGAKIQDIERMSGASIQLSKPERSGVTFTPATLRSVSITGGEEQVERCRLLIEQCIAQPSPGFKPGRGSKQKQAAIGTAGRPGGGKDERRETNSIGVPTSCVARLLERKGLGVKRMQEQSGAKIELPKVRPDDSPDKMVTVTLSGSHAQVIACWKLMHNIVVELSAGGGGGGGGGSGGLQTTAIFQPAYADHMADQAHEEVIVQIPDESVGRVIGKKGSHIKKIQDDSGARVYLPKDCAVGTAHREMKITGARHQVQSCIESLSRSLTPPGEQLVVLDVATVSMSQHQHHQHQHHQHQHHQNRQHPAQQHYQHHPHQHQHQHQQHSPQQLAMPPTMIGFDGTPYSVVGAHTMQPMASIPYGIPPAAYGYGGGNAYVPPPQQQQQMFEYHQPQFAANPYMGGPLPPAAAMVPIPQGYSPMAMHGMPPTMQPAMQQAISMTPPPLVQGMPPGTAVYAVSETEYSRIKPALTQIQSETGASIDASEPFEAEYDGGLQSHTYDPCREIVIRGDMVAVHQCESMIGRILNRGPGML